jgi:dihydropteroate synthase
MSDEPRVPGRASPPPLTIRGRRFDWGARTWVMGILNVTPDSFSGDGLLTQADVVAAAVSQAVRMAGEGADLLDVGGESTRPGHAPVSMEDERSRVVPVIAAVRAALPEMPLSIDTAKRPVAEAALDAGADLLNDVTATGPMAELTALAADRGVPLILMHGRRAEPFRDVVTEVIGDLARALARAIDAGCRPETLMVDPGIGFGKTAEQNLALLRALGRLGELGRPVLLGTSRKSTIGRVLGLPPEDRLEGTLATTALGVASGVDLVRVHDVAQNVRVARMADAIVRGWRDPDVAG